jgi:hypothetical protein
VHLTEAQRYLLANAAESGGCWLWELGAATESHLDDRILRWNGLAPESAQQAALALVRAGLAVVNVEPVDAHRRYTGEIRTAEADEGIAALSDSANWTEPWLSPPRPASYSLATTPGGDVEVERAGWPEPDEVRVKQANG